MTVVFVFFFFQAEDGIRDLVRSRGLGDVYKRQDLDRAVIVGQRTFGKGLVQTTRPLSYNTQLKITTAKYYVPSGRCIQALSLIHI